jgi:hypothetical protein
VNGEWKGFVLRDVNDIRDGKKGQPAPSLVRQKKGRSGAGKLEVADWKSYPAPFYEGSAGWRVTPLII